jgi:hypothetical protein
MFIDVLGLSLKEILYDLESVAVLLGWQNYHFKLGNARSVALFGHVFGHLFARVHALFGDSDSH